MAMKDEPGKQLIELIKLIGLPVIALVIFFSLWDFASTRIQTSVGQIVEIPQPNLPISNIKSGRIKWRDIE